tara:strand:+ start:409 stop:609 length:201 start_codon:yes stop_codon:yes gene_type:complete
MSDLANLGMSSKRIQELLNAEGKLTAPEAGEQSPTMAELLSMDIKDSSGFLTTNDITDLIAKGWKK